MKETVRDAAMAGLFYPSDPDVLRREVEGFLQDVTQQGSVPPKALIVPHAGFVYSGPIAARGYAQIISAPIERVVLIGPSHREAFYGLAAPEARHWASPLGGLEIDFQALEELPKRSPLIFSDLIHAEEHCLEVQLPFLQLVLGDFRLIPLVVGEASVDEVAEVLDAAWGGPETLVVVSSDLSHYESYDRAVVKDRSTAEAIERFDVHGLESDYACGLTPIAGFLQVARQKGLRCELLDLRNSGDTAGPRDRVVGYGAFAFYE